MHWIFKIWNCFAPKTQSEEEHNQYQPSSPRLLTVPRIFSGGDTRISSESRRPLRRNSSINGLRPVDSALWNSLNDSDRPGLTMASGLSARLEDAQIEWPPEQHHYFIPIGTLNNIVTVSAVKEELKNAHPDLPHHKIVSYANSICRSAKKLYTILLCMKKGNFICSFLDEGITDVDLPFVRSTLPSQIQTRAVPFQLCKAEHVHCGKHDHKACGIKALTLWSQRDIGNLSRDQWLVQAPTFIKIPGKIHHQELDPNVILPFIEDHEGLQDAMSGGYSHVWGVRVHLDHQNVYSSTDPQVVEPLLAIKRPFSRDVKDFKKETNMLSTLAVRNHPHLIQLLATYKYRNHYHLVFPFANTNLRGYWDDTGIPYWNKKTYLWLARQICGLASGLNAIHNFEAEIPLGDEEANQHLKVVSHRKYLTVAPNEAKYGRHGDIKPENILWSNELKGFGKEGILQISDMGLGRFHKLESRSGLNPKTISGSPTYTPPEVELEKPVSRAYDIWSLGCVYLEFITWLLEGASKVYSFSSARDSTGADGISDDLFYTIVAPEEGDKKYAVVRQGVLDWITRLRNHERCSGMVLDLLNIVEKKMLAIDSADRIRCDVLDARLGSILAKAESDIQYLLGPNAPIIDPDLGVKIPKGPKTLYVPTTVEDSDGDSDMTDAPIIGLPTIVEPNGNVGNNLAGRLVREALPPRR